MKLSLIKALSLTSALALIVACGSVGSQVVEFPDDSGGVCTCNDASGTTNTDSGSSSGGDTGTGGGDTGTSTGGDSGSSGGHDAGTVNDSGTGGGNDSGGGGNTDSGSGGGADAGGGNDSGSGGGGHHDGGGTTCGDDDDDWSCGHRYGCCVSDCAHDCHQKHPSPSCKVGQDCFKACQAKCEEEKDECEAHDRGDGACKK